VTQAFNFGYGSAFAKHLCYRIARNHVNETKDKCDDDENHRQRQEKPPDKEGEHEAAV
jgi:hypothetical protein